MMMREQQWDRSNCRHFRIDVCLHQRIYMRAFVNARNHTACSSTRPGPSLTQPVPTRHRHRSITWEPCRHSILPPDAGNYSDPAYPPPGASSAFPPSGVLDILGNNVITKYCRTNDSRCKTALHIYLPKFLKATYSLTIF